MSEEIKGFEGHSPLPWKLSDRRGERVRIVDAEDYYPVAGYYRAADARLIVAAVNAYYAGKHNAPQPRGCRAEADDVGSS